MSNQADIAALLNDKAKKPKEKTGTLSQWLLTGRLTANEVTAFAIGAKDPVKATCIEALEYATKEKPSLANRKTFQFVTDALAAKAPRVKWESAKVIANTAHLFTGDLNAAIDCLIINSKHEGTVVRWSAAFALAEILRAKTKHNSYLLPTIKRIIEKEEKDSIKKIYLSAVKKVAQHNKPAPTGPSKPKKT